VSFQVAFKAVSVGVATIVMLVLLIRAAFALWP
jgi:hypothetical protein